MLFTKQISQLRLKEFLPIITGNPSFLDQPLGSTWIPTQSVALPNKQILYMLSLTDPGNFLDFPIFYKWDNTIYPPQLSIPQSLTNIHLPNRKRSWNHETSTSKLNYPPITETEELTPPSIHKPCLKQEFEMIFKTDSPSTNMFKNEQLICTPTSRRDCQHSFIRYQGPKFNQYYIKHTEITVNGISIELQESTLFYRRIVGLKYRFLYKKLSSLTQENWTPFFADDFCILSIRLPHAVIIKINDALNTQE